MAGTELALSLISALAGSAVLTTLISFFQTKRKQGAEGRVAEKTESFQVGIVEAQEWDAKLGILQRVIAVLEQHNDRIEKDLDHQYDLNTRLTARVRELEASRDKFESVIRKLCMEAGVDPNLYLS